MPKRRRRSRHCFENVPNVPFLRNSNRSPGQGALNHGISYQSAGIEERPRQCRDDSPMHAPGQGNAYMPGQETGERAGIIKSSALPVPDCSALPVADCSELPVANGLTLSAVNLRDAEATEHSTPGVVQESGCLLNDAIPEFSSHEDKTIAEFRTPITNWTVLWALLRTCGNQRLTKEQYQSLRLFTEAIVRDGLGNWKENPDTDENRSEVITATSYMPHYSTLYKSVKPFVFRSLTVRSFIHQTVVDLRKAGARSKGISLSGDPTTTLKTVLPSEYARADVATPVFLEAMKRTSISHYGGNGLHSTVPCISTVDCVDLLPLIAARDWFYGPPKHISVDDCADSLPPTFTAEAGDVLSMTLLPQGTAGDLDESLQRSFRGSLDSSGRPTVMGKVVDIWTVRHGKRALGADEASFDGEEDALSGLSVQDEHIRGLFDFVMYCSPSDSVTVEVPDLHGDDQEDANQDRDGISMQRRMAELKRLRRMRKMAMDERRRQIELAWRNWEKPIIKPGDTVALLCPCIGTGDGRPRQQRDAALLTSNDLLSRLLLVNRYWTEHEERSTHIVWIPGGVDLQSELLGLQKTIDAFANIVAHHSLTL